MTELLLTLLKLSVVALILAIGMSSTFSDLAYLWRRPVLLVRSFLAMYVLVPLAAWFLVKVFPIAPPVKAALLILAASAGAPLLPRKLLGLGSGAYIFSLVVTSSVLAIILVPAWVALLGQHFEAAAELSPTDVAFVVAKTFLVPLAIGMIFRACAAGWCERFANRLLAFAGIVMAVSGVALIALHWEVFLQVRVTGVAALVALLLTALAIGHALGGPSPDDRTALAVACSTRHIGLAVLVASSFPGSRSAVLVAAYIVTSLLITLPYLRWRRLRGSRQMGEDATE
jgi:BASS family bile acid:Na+ symporter